MEDFIKDFIKDVEIELSDEFDRNFERKAFFDKAWPAPRLSNSRGSTLMRSSALRRSIKSASDENGITWKSPVSYATIHNEGGEITVTDKMKRFFWAMYYKSAGAITTKKNGEQSNSRRNQMLTAEASRWKAMALLKVGSKIKIQQRQFIGNHPNVNRAIEQVWNDHFKDFERHMQNILRRR